MKLPNSRGFTILETLVVTSVIAVLATVSLVVLSTVKDNAADQKLRKDVASLNSAVEVYLTNGGDLAGATNPMFVMAKLKKVAAPSSSRRIVGLKGSMLDVRMVMVEQTAAQAVSGDLRAHWDKDNLKFYVSTSGGKGIARFRIDENSAVTGGSESRATSLQYAQRGRWVWDYMDRSRGGGTAPADIPGGPGTPPGILPTGPSLAKPLLSPVIDVPGREYDLNYYPMTVSITDPNTASASELMYSIDSAVWVLYTGPVAIQPGDKLEAIAFSADPDHWSDSLAADAELYTSKRVAPELALTLPSSVNYFELGGMAMATPGTSPGDAYPPALPGTVSLLNGAAIPDDFESSALFQVYWTKDGTSPLTSPTRRSGLPFAGEFVDQEIGFSLDDLQGSSAMIPVTVVAEALDKTIFEDSDQHEAALTVSVLRLRAPVVTVGESTVSMGLPTEYGDMPVGAVIYYTTDGSDPGVGSDNGPLNGELYSGSIEPDDDAIITARVYPPSEYSKWFAPSKTTVQELDSDLVREVYIAGRFSLPDGRYRNISKLGEDGSVDTTFDPGIGASYGSIIAALVPVTGGRIIAGGDFDAMGKVRRGGLVRMLSDGSVDTSFNAALSNAPAP